MYLFVEVDGILVVFISILINIICYLREQLRWAYAFHHYVGKSLSSISIRNSSNLLSPLDSICICSSHNFVRRILLPLSTIFKDISNVLL